MSLEELSSSQLTEPLMDSSSESKLLYSDTSNLRKKISTQMFLGNSQNPFLKTESASQEYSPYFSHFSSKLIANSSNDYGKENHNYSFNNSYSKFSERRLSSQEASSTNNPFVSPQRMTTAPIKRKSEYGEDAALKQLNLDRFMYSFNSTSV